MTRKPAQFSKAAIDLFETQQELKNIDAWWCPKCKKRTIYIDARIPHKDQLFKCSKCGYVLTDEEYKWMLYHDDF